MSAADKPVLVYATFPDKETATRCGRNLVEQRLAACANLSAPITSIYRWEGRVEEAPEIALLIKTRTGLADAVTEAIVSGHPYANPAVLVLDIAGGAGAFLAWILAETQPPADTT